MKSKLPLLILSVLAGAASAFGQLVTYNFTGAAGDQASQPTASVSANVTASAISRGSGLTASAAGGSISSSGFTTTGFDANDYYEFSVAPTSGFSLDLGTLSFAERRSGTGIRGWSIRTSLDSFSSDLTSVSVPDDTATRDQSFVFGSAFDSVTSTLFIRVYGFSAEAGTGTWRLANNSVTTNMQLTGTVSAVPESSAFAAVAGLAALGGAALRRRRRA